MTSDVSRSTCIWCARVVADPSVPCSNRDLSNLDVAPDDICRAVLRTKMQRSAPLSEFGAKPTE